MYRFLAPVAGGVGGDDRHGVGAFGEEHGGVEAVAGEGYGDAVNGDGGDAGHVGGGAGDLDRGLVRRRVR